MVLYSNWFIAVNVKHHHTGKERFVPKKGGEEAGLPSKHLPGCTSGVYWSNVSLTNIQTAEPKGLTYWRSKYCVPKCLMTHTYDNNLFCWLTHFSPVLSFAAEASFSWRIWSNTRENVYMYNLSKLDLWLFFLVRNVHVIGSRRREDKKKNRTPAGLWLLLVSMPLCSPCRRYKKLDCK